MKLNLLVNFSKTKINLPILKKLVPIFKDCFFMILVLDLIKK
jgi:hypothetical protein